MDVRMILDRDSVHAGDDVSSHELDHRVPGGRTLREFAGRLPQPGFVPTRDTWAVYQVLGAEHPFEGFPPRSDAISTVPLAVIARNSGALRYHLDPETPLSALAGEGGRVSVFCRSCRNRGSTSTGR